MFRKRQREASGGECSWPVIGVDEPYPPMVAEALKRVEAETLRRLRETCEHPEGSRKQLSRSPEAMINMWTDHYRCGVCRAEWYQTEPMRMPQTVVPIMIDAPAGLAGRAGSPIDDWIVRLSVEAMERQPRQVGALRASIEAKDRERRRAQRRAQWDTKG